MGKPIPRSTGLGVSEAPGQCGFTGKSPPAPTPTPWVLVCPAEPRRADVLQRDLSDKTEVDLFWLGFGV